MRRRKMLLATGGLLASATAGCLGTGPGSETTPQPTVNVEVEFAVKDGDLVASHLSGDVLQSGQTVYVTIEADQVAEKTLSSDVHTGGEIIRVSGAEGDYHQTRRVGLYLRRESQSQELAAKDFQFDHPAPATMIEFDYSAAEGTVVLRGDLSGDCRLTVKGNSVSDSDVNWNAPVNGSGTSVTLTGSVGNDGKIVTVSNVTSSGETINLVWSTTDGSYSMEIGTWEAP